MKKTIKIIKWIIITIIIAFPVLYLIHAINYRLTWQAMQNYNESYDPKKMLSSKDLSHRELKFMDSLKQLKFETVTFEKIEGYERYSLVLSYKRTRPFKPFFPDSSERFKLAIAQTFYCNYLNIHRKPEIHSIFVKDLDFSIPETEYSISELEMGCMK